MSATSTKTVLVSAGIVIEDGRVLLSRRKAGGHLAGAWEFPGGKVEPAEDPRDALVREMREELGIDVTVNDIVECTFHHYADAQKSVLLLFFSATRTASSPAPQALDVAELRWAERAELHDDEFPPADVAVLAKVRKLLS
jgi:8-oxo-dGTP diphosphatase